MSGIPPPSSPPPTYVDANLIFSRLTALEQRFAQSEHQGIAIAEAYGDLHGQLGQVLVQLSLLVPAATGGTSPPTANPTSPTANPTASIATVAKTPMVLSSPLPSQAAEGGPDDPSEAPPSDEDEEPVRGRIHSKLTSQTLLRTPGWKDVPQQPSLMTPHSALKLDRLLLGMGLAAPDDEASARRSLAHGPEIEPAEDTDVSRLVNKPTEFKGGDASALATVQWVRAMDKFLKGQKKAPNPVTKAFLASTYLRDKAESWFHSWVQTRLQRGDTSSVTWTELMKALLKKHKCHLLEERSRRQLSALPLCTGEDNVEKYLRNFDALRLNCFSQSDSVLMQRLYDLTIGIPYIYERTQVEFHTYESVDDMLDRLYDIEEVHYQAYGKPSRQARRNSDHSTPATTAAHHLNALASMALSKKHKDKLRHLIGDPGRSNSISANKSLVCFGCGQAGHRADSDDCPAKDQRDAKDPHYLAARRERVEAWKKSRAASFQTRK
jgi:hypothetical protein